MTRLTPEQQARLIEARISQQKARERIQKLASDSAMRHVDILYSLEHIGRFSSGVFVNHQSVHRRQTLSEDAPWDASTLAQDPPFTRRKLLSMREVEPRKEENDIDPATVDLALNLQKSLRLRGLLLDPYVFVVSYRIVSFEAKTTLQRVARDLPVRGFYASEPWCFHPMYEVLQVSQQELSAYCAEQLWSGHGILRVFSDSSLQIASNHAQKYMNFLVQNQDLNDKTPEVHLSYLHRESDALLQDGHRPSFFQPVALSS